MPRGGATRRAYSRTVTLADKRSRAVNLIAYCTPERFAVLTADDVAAHSGLPVAVVAKMLAEAKGRRG